MIYKNPTRHLLFTSLLFSSISAFAADGFIEHGRITYPTIRVESNGESYHDVSLSNPSQKLAVPTYIELDAGRDKLIKGVAISTLIQHGIGTAHRVGYSNNFALTPNSLKTYIEEPNPANYTRRFEHTITQRVSAYPLRGHAQDMCNQVADGLRRQGKTNREIFSRTHFAHFNVKTIVEFTLAERGYTPVLSSGISKIIVTCGRDTGRHNRGDGGDIPRVKHIALRASKARDCKLQLTGNMLTSHANRPFVYKLMFNRQLLDREYTVTSGSNKRASINHVFSISDDIRFIDLAAGTVPKSGSFQVVSDSLRSSVARYSVNCLLPIIKPSLPKNVKAPRLKPKLPNGVLLNKKFLQKK